MSSEVNPIQVKLANPRGFCAGVDRAIVIVEKVLELYGAPIYVRHEVVHNKFVIERLKALGVVFVEELDEVPDDSVVIFSAHGVASEVFDDAKQRGLKYFDATCPLVTKVHIEVGLHAKANRECVLIGHAGHPEVVGTLGQYPDDGPGIYLVETKEQVLELTTRGHELAYVTQTTLSVDETKEIIEALKQRFPSIISPRKDDICYATQNRQDAVRTLALETEAVMVIGSANSSNSNRLKDLAEACGRPAILIDDPSELKADWFKGFKTLGVTAGASAPEELVHNILNKLGEFYPIKMSELSGTTEDVVFYLPKELR